MGITVTGKPTFACYGKRNAGDNASYLLPQHLGRIIFVAATERMVVATLSELIQTLAQVTRLPSATAFAYGRFAREAGYISQSGRGTNAAKMTFADAANIFLALGGTGITREAGPTIKKFRSLKGFSVAPLDSAFRQWLKPLGIKKTTKEYVDPIKSDLGTVVEFLLEEAASGRMSKFLRSIPVADIDDKTYRRYRLRPKPTEMLLESGVPKMDPSRITVGWECDVWIEFEFIRTTPSLQMRFLRNGVDEENLCVLHFRAETWEAQRDMEISAEFSQTTLAALAYCVSHGPLPRNLRLNPEFDDFLFGIERQQ